MYAIIRNGNGKYYTSLVFGFYCPITSTDDYQRYLQGVHNRFYLVLNEEKTQIIRKFIFPSDNKYLDPQVLIVDADHSDWDVDENGYGCISKLNGIDFEGTDFCIPIDILTELIGEDARYSFNEYPKIRNDADIENLMWVSGGFHDAFIENWERKNDAVYVLFDGTWGCRIELWFEGDAACAVKSRDPLECDPNWYGSSFFKSGEYFYLVDEEDMTAEEITEDYCWFRGKQVRYHVIPNK